MTVPLSPDSPRLPFARRFGLELDRAMRARKIGAKRLGPATGVAISSIANWRAGGNLPRHDTALRLAEALTWPKLVEIVREGRSRACDRCQVPFVDEGGRGNKRFCSKSCQLIDQQLRRPQHGAELARQMRMLLAMREGTKGGLPKAIVRDALGEYNRAAAKARNRVDQQGRQLTVVQSAVAAFCGACEPAGLCRSEECELRPASPLPLEKGRREIAVLRPAEGAWSPKHRPTVLAAIRSANAERWNRPGERERQGQKTAARFAAMSDDERAAHRAKISAARRGEA